MKDDPIRVLLVDDQVAMRRGLAMLLLAVDDLLLVGAAQNGSEALALCEAAQPDVVLMDLLMPEMDGVEATQAIRERFPDVHVIALTDWIEYDLVQRALAAGADSYLFKSSSATDLAVAIRTAHATEEQEPATKLKKALTEREREVLGLMAQGLTRLQICAELTIEPASLMSYFESIARKILGTVHSANGYWPGKAVDKILTGCEGEVLTLMLQGLTRLQIAVEMTIEPVNLLSHMESILVKIEDMVYATGKPEPATKLKKALTEREREVLALMARGLTNPQIGDELFISAATAKFHVSSILGKLDAATRTEAVALAMQRNLIPDPQ